MGLSETIVAAMIGALATVSAAVFQIFSSIKNRNKVDVKPRRGSTLRSMFAVFSLMVASAVGGFLYSEYLKQRDSEDLRAMRMELRELKELTTATRATPPAPDRSPSAAIAGAKERPPAQAAPVAPPSGAVPVTATSNEGRVESLAYVPACRRAPVEGVTACAESDAQRIALCGSVPAYARIDAIDLFAQPDAVQRPWDQHRVALEQDLGGARFTGKSFEYAQSAELKAVCVNFMQWSSEHPHIARIVVSFGFGDAPATVIEQQPGGPVPAVIAVDTLAPTSQQASFATNTKP